MARPVPLSYRFLPTRSRFSGKTAVQSDGVGVYRKLGEEGYEGIIRMPCIQHIKRKFLELKDNPRAARILKLYNLLFNRDHLSAYCFRLIILNSRSVGDIADDK